MSKKQRVTPVTRVLRGVAESTADEVVVEAPLSMSITFGPRNQTEVKSLAVTMRTPGEDKFLCAGFMLTEGIVNTRSAIEDIVIEDLGNDVARAQITIAPGHILDIKKLERNIYTNSSCGMCSKSTLESIEVSAPSLENQEGPKLSYAQLYKLPEKLIQAQLSFNRTGGMHAAALFNQEAQCIDLQEDVGRHNALDKLIGKALLGGDLPLGNHAVLLSGRAGFELIQKSHVAGISLVLALGAPTSLSIALAHRAGITLVGFLKNERFNIYTHPHRICKSPEG
jgi:FdhD protein